MPLQDLIGELQNTNSYDWPTLRLWLKRFTALSSGNESIAFDQFLIIYRKMKNIVGLDSSLFFPVDPPPPTELLLSPQVRAREISTQQAISVLLAIPLNLDKNDEEELTNFLNTEYTALSDHLLLDISSLDKTKKKWVQEAVNEIYLQNILIWILFEEQIPTLDLRIFFYFLNQLVKIYFQDPALLLLKKMLNKLSEKPPQKEFYFASAMSCLLAVETPISPRLFSQLTKIVFLNPELEPIFEEALIKYASIFKQSPDALNGLIRYELAKFYNWVWREENINQLKLRRSLNFFSSQESMPALYKEKYIDLPPSLSLMLNDLFALQKDLSKDPVQILINCKLLATNALNNEKSKKLLENYPLLKCILRFFASGSVKSFDDNEVPCNPRLWQLINRAMENSKAKKIEKEKALTTPENSYAASLKAQLKNWQLMVKFRGTGKKEKEEAIEPNLPPLAQIPDI